MRRPLIITWMKKSSNQARIRIYTGEVSTFMAIAMKAGQSEVLSRIVAVMLSRYDVFDFQRRQRRSRLRQLAVFTAVTSATANKLAGGSVHYADFPSLTRRAFA
jgi:hypothetical protein